MKNRVTSPRITKFEKNEIFVFGSNLAGMHGGGGAAAIAGFTAPQKKRNLCPGIRKVDGNCNEIKRERYETF